MGRPRKNEKTIGIGARLEAGLMVRFNNLCRANGVSVREGLRRAITGAVLEGRIPGLDPMVLPDSIESERAAQLPGQRDDIEGIERERQELDDPSSELPVSLKYPPAKGRK